MRYIAIDPGSQKTGLAVAEQTSLGLEPLEMKVVDLEDLPKALSYLLTRHNPEFHLIGSGTGSKAVIAQLNEWFPEVSWHRVDERNSTLEARLRYFQVHPPKGWRKWIPKSLLLPPVPYDDFVALILIERFVEEKDSGAK